MSLLIGMYRERNIAAWQSKAGQAVLRACVYLKLSESFLSRLMITKVNWWYLRKYSTCDGARTCEYVSRESESTDGARMLRDKDRSIDRELKTDLSSLRPSAQQV